MENEDVEATDEEMKSIGFTILVVMGILISLVISVTIILVKLF